MKKILREIFSSSSGRLSSKRILAYICTLTGIAMSIVLLHFVMITGKDIPDNVLEVVFIMIRAGLILSGFTNALEGIGALLKGKSKKEEKDKNEGK